MPPENLNMDCPTSEPVSNTKIRAWNKHIFLWRVYEHDKKWTWEEDELFMLYEREVEPFGYNFCFYKIVRTLGYESYVKNSSIKKGMGTVEFNPQRVVHYVRKIGPEPPPPVLQEKPKKKRNRGRKKSKKVDDAVDADLKALEILYDAGTARNSVPIREDRLLERYNVKGASNAMSFPAFLNCMLEKRLIVRSKPEEERKLKFCVDKVKTAVTLFKKKDESSSNCLKSELLTMFAVANQNKVNKPGQANQVQMTTTAKSPPSNTRKQKNTNRTVNRLMKESGLAANSRYEWVSKREPGENVNKNRDAFVDQRRAFRVGFLSDNAPVPNQDGIYFLQDIDYCSECALSFESNEQLEDHNDLDEHKFMVIYGMNRGKGSNLSPPPEMSGYSEGIMVQSTGGTEGCNVFVVSLIMKTEEPCQIEINLDVSYDPLTGESENWSLANIFTVVCGDEDIFIDSSLLPLQLIKGDPLTKKFTIECYHPGFREYVLAFKLSCGSKSSYRELFVMKKLHVRIDNQYTLDDDSNIASNSMRQYPKFNESHTKDEEDFNIIEPELVEQAEFPPLPKHSLVMVNKLKDYPLPWRYIRFFNYGFSMGPTPRLSTLQNMLTVLQCFEAGIVPFNYAEYFKLLLYLEEHQILCGLRVYAMTDASLEKSRSGKNNFYLNVPGLAEKRPSVIPCDAIYITTVTGVYKGFVNLVEQKRIRFSMGPSFVHDFHPSMLVSVHFSFNRVCLKVQHRAIEIMSKGSSLTTTLFPKEFGKFKENHQIAHWFNVKIASNPSQRQAVQNILNGTSKPAPFLLFGPPGTGKTVTMVESIKQVYFLKQQSHILAVAPSNSAADLLAIKVLDSIPQSQVIRLYSPSVKCSQVPPKLRVICNFDDRDACVFPNLQHLKKFRIIVCTVICAGRLYSGNFPAGYFSHIFIDECGHGMEPSALVPIAGLLGPPNMASQIVLSGDPKQLGPIVRSPVALTMGLGDSLLVRLMDSVELYQKNEGSYNTEVLTKLTYNYRSHPQILKVPNDLFYEGELIPCGDTSITSSACDLPWLPQRGFPLIFHGVNGRDEQHPSSPSFFNTAEVYEVVKYARKVLSSTFNGQQLRQSDIGVVSPYRGQLNKIMRTLRSNEMPDIRVGSVEEFQGQERRVIIISTVRSNPAQLKLDHKFSLGFVREPRRFNVAVTRASALLIVIGNPYLLQTDPNWRALLEHIFVNGGYTHTNCPFKLGPPIEYKIHSTNQQLLSIRQKLTEQKDRIKAKIAQMEEGADASMSKNESKVDELINQIRRMNFFSEDGLQDVGD